ncbi:hypothetical protein HDU79_001244 [Rhizoclosmatium sp. JEL0117]|nr:hypothetical protein HDU79_001244 [Rhizoclosmatium sp. JEL0117]
MTQSHNTVRVTLEFGNVAAATPYYLAPPKLFACNEIQYETHTWYNRGAICQDLTPIPPHTVAQLLDKIIITDSPNRPYIHRDIGVTVTTLYTAPRYAFQKEESEVTDVQPPPHTTAKLKNAGAHTYYFCYAKSQTEDEYFKLQFLSNAEMATGITRLNSLPIPPSAAVYQTILKYGYTSSCYVSTDTLRSVVSAMFEFNVDLCYRFLHMRSLILTDAEIFEFLIVCFITNCKDGFDLAAERLATVMTMNRETSRNPGFLNINCSMLTKLPFDVLEEIIKSPSFFGRSKLQWRLVVGHTKAWQGFDDVSLRGPTNLRFFSANKYLHSTLTFIVYYMVSIVTKEEYDTYILPYVDLAMHRTHTAICRPKTANYVFGAGWDVEQ